MCFHRATSSPRCAGKALKQTVDDNEKDNRDKVGQRALDIIRSCFYVGYCLSSVESVDFATKVVQRLVNILSKGGFKLTKWLSNERRVLYSRDESERVPFLPVSLDKLPTERTLGVCWDAENDDFTFHVSLREKSISRRGVLSVTSPFTTLWGSLPHLY